MLWTPREVPYLPTKLGAQDVGRLRMRIFLSRGAVRGSSTPLLAEGAVRSPQKLLSRRHVRTTGRGAILVLAASAAAAVPAEAQPSVTLEQVVRLAAERNERARISAAQAEAAAGRVQRSRAFFFPELTVSGAYTRRLHETVRNVGDGRVTISRRDALSAQANLTVPLFDARLFPLYRQAKLEGLSASLAAAAERRLLGYEAADAFLMVLSQQHVVEAATRRLEFSRVTLRDARARVEAGLVSSNDVTRSELEAVTAEREMATARASAATARLELGHLVDSELAGALATPEGLLAEASRPPASAAQLIAAGVERRLDLKSGATRVQALQAAADEPGRRIIPSLAGVAQYRVTNEQGFSGRVGDGFAGLTATWALFDGGERYGERAERRALARAGAAEQDGARAVGGAGGEAGAGRAWRTRSRRSGWPGAPGRSPGATWRRRPPCTGRAWAARWRWRTRTCGCSRPRWRWPGNGTRWPWPSWGCERPRAKTRPG